ncbi:UPF0149 family protein [Echinimonas agarilytica]|uniref:UPF0149 family protein n=1 Tax=Echinimonas agarilytica TaxID=1215918 RepID=A0AA41W4N8_9GAMM|nr:UPF0149 family protein [Echinimonas agarilytica]MCM2678889.1 UPF0149 family protein [Echinimonas agarilytica]
MYQAPSLFEALTEALNSKSLLTDAAEVHGIIVGQLSGGLAHEDESWRASLVDLVNNGEALPVEVMRLVDDMRNVTLENLMDDQLGFRLLLPDDSAPFEEQIVATTQWVQGFLAGFSIAQPQLKDASEDLQECIRDLSEIALLDVPEDPDEESDIALNELHEYIRIAAMMAFAEFGLPPNKAPEKPALH